MSAHPCSFDTSVVMRLLVGAPLAQFRAATRFLEERVAAGMPALVGDLVVAEAYFALQSSYGMPKEDAVALLAQFSKTPGVAVSDHARRILAMPGIARMKPGFVDRLVHGSALAAGATLLTFEKAADTLPHTIILD